MTDKIDTSAAAIAKLLDGVTGGPWSLFNPLRGRILSVCIGKKANGRRPCIIDSGGFEDTELFKKENIANARFISASRELVPALAAERDALAAERDALRADVERLTVALAPFAKVGALFGEREIMDDGFQIGDCYIFQPAAGEEYWLTGDHLRAAAKALKGGDA